MKLHSNRTRAAFCASLLLLGACQTAPKGPEKPEPRFYDGYGGYHRAITTESEEAQRWFDQGLQLLYGFNHDEAIRSFEAAAELDPKAAMAHWGVAYAHGLHINNPAMGAKASEAAYRASVAALAQLDDETAVERALVEALQARYAWPVPEDRKPLDEAYAQRMERVFELHPGDADVGALFAESLMNLQPWDLWTREGTPKGRTLDVIAALETALSVDPLHPGANHFYIHAVEASPDPARAVPAADRLRNLVPGSGHLVHMPSHIDVRVGNYAAASDANEAAIAADRAYFALAPAPDFYSIYYLHNVHMLAFSGMMEARFELAMGAARRLEQEVPADFLKAYVSMADGLMATPLHVLIRFGRWQEILEETAPPEWRLLSLAQWHYARGVALAAMGRPEEARVEQQEFERVAAAVPEDWTSGNNAAADVLSLSRHMLEGEILFREGQHAEAFAMLRAGAALEDQLVYDEPPGWMQPIRHALGALLMAAGHHSEAEAVYREDLVRHPKNGWSLLGLELALEARGASGEAALVAAERAIAWKRADTAPNSSCFCEPGEVAAAPKSRHHLWVSGAAIR